MVNASAPGTRGSEQWRPFWSCSHVSCVEFGRRGKAGAGRGTSTWQKMWLEHEVMAQQCLAIGVASSSAHQAVAAKIQYWLCSKACSWRVRWGEWGWEGKKCHSKTGEKGERSTDRLGRKERCDQGREQGNKILHYSMEERVGIWKGNRKFVWALEKIKVEETLGMGQEM